MTKNKPTRPANCRLALNMGCAATLLLASGAALAQTAAPAAQAALPFQAELSYVPLKATDQGVTAKPEMLRLGLSQEVHRFLDVELLVGTKLQDDEVNTLAGPINAEVQYHAGIYLKPKVTFTPELQAFARLGYGRTKGKTDLGDRAESDVSYGLGLSYAITRQVAATVDHMRYVNKDGVEVRGYSLGLGYRF